MNMKRTAAAALAAGLATVASERALAIDILIWDNSQNHHAQAAAEAVGATITSVTDESSFKSKTLALYDVVIVDQPNFIIGDAAAQQIASFVSTGGRLIFSYWDLDGSSAASSAATLRTAFGIDSTGDFTSPKAVHTWTKGSPIFTFPNTVDSLSIAGVDSYTDNGDMLRPNGYGAQVAGFSGSVDPSQGAIVLASGGSCIVHGFLFDDMAAAPMRNLLVNEIRQMALPLLRGYAAVYSDSGDSFAYRAAVAQGFLTYQYATIDDMDYWLNNFMWDVFLVDAQANCLPASTALALNDYVKRRAGRVILNYWDTDGDSCDASAAATIRTTFDVASVSASLSSPEDVFFWQKNHPVFTRPYDVASRGHLGLAGGDAWGDNGDELRPGSGGYGVGGFSAGASSSRAGIVVGNQGRTIMNGFTYDDMDGLWLSRLLENEVGFAGSPRTLIWDQSHDQMAAYATFWAGGNGRTVFSNSEFLAALPDTRFYDLLFIDQPSSTIVKDSADAIAAFIAKGGRVILSYWDMDGNADPDSAAVLRAAFHITGTTEITTPEKVYRWDSGHPVFTYPYAVSTMSPEGPDDWIDNGDEFTTGVCVDDLGGFAPSQTTGRTAIALGAGGRTILNGFMWDDMDGARQALVIDELVHVASRRCRSDFNGDGAWNINDFVAFQNAWQAQKSAADWNGDCKYNVNDYLAFQASWNKRECE